MTTATARKPRSTPAAVRVRKAAPPRPQPLDKPASSPAPAPAPQAKPTPTATAYEFILVNGEFQIHRPGCRDTQALIKAKATDYPTPGTDVAASTTEVLRQLYADQIAEWGWQADELEDTPDSDSDPQPTDAAVEAHYSPSVHFNKCLRFPRRAGKPNAVAARRDAKQALARLAVQALDAMVANLFDENMAADTDNSYALVLRGMSNQEAARTVSQWIHHLPTGDAPAPDPDPDTPAGAPTRLWPATTLPRPDRSDWAPAPAPQAKPTPTASRLQWQ